MSTEQTEYAFVHLTRLCGCNFKVQIARTRQSVYVEDPLHPGRRYRVKAAAFDAGELQIRDSWCIEPWSDRAERRMRAEANEMN